MHLIMVTNRTMIIKDIAMMVMGGSNRFWEMAISWEIDNRVGMGYRSSVI